MNWYRLSATVNRIAKALCRHPEGIVCKHRQYEYDHWYRGYNAGFGAGQQNVEAKWAGNLSGVGPYAGYPPPRPSVPVAFHD